MGIEDKLDSGVTQLSGGQQQRIAIARAVVTHPDIVLADEPTGNLDYNTSLEIMELFMQLKKEEKQSFIVVTHDPIIATYADRVIFLHDGEIKNEYKNEEGSVIFQIYSLCSEDLWREGEKNGERRYKKIKQDKP